MLEMIRSTSWREREGLTEHKYSWRRPKQNCEYNAFSCLEKTYTTPHNHYGQHKIGRQNNTGRGR